MFGFVVVRLLAVPIEFSVFLGQAIGGNFFVMFAIYVATMFLSNLIANNAVAALMFPVAMDVAKRQYCHIIPFCICGFRERNQCQSYGIVVDVGIVIGIHVSVWISDQSHGICFWWLHHHGFCEIWSTHAGQTINDQPMSQNQASYCTPTKSGMAKFRMQIHCDA